MSSGEDFLKSDIIYILGNSTCPFHFCYSFKVVSRAAHKYLIPSLFPGIQYSYFSLRTELRCGLMTC